MNDFKTFLNAVDNSQNDFIAPLVFATIILLGLLIGFWNGFKTVTFFAVLNIFCIAGAIAIFHFSGDIAKKIIPNSWKLNTTNALQLAKEGNDGVKNIIGLLFALGIFSGMNLIFFWPCYFIFRKSLKASMFENKQAKLSNLKHRFGGAAISLVIAIPIAVLTAVLLTPLGSQKSGFVNFISEFSSVILAKQARMIPQNIYDLVSKVK